MLPNDANGINATETRNWWKNSLNQFSTILKLKTNKIWKKEFNLI